jgi:hypothetical protein
LKALDKDLRVFNQEEIAVKMEFAFLSLEISMIASDCCVFDCDVYAMEIVLELQRRFEGVVYVFGYVTLGCRRSIAEAFEERVKGRKF